MRFPGENWLDEVNLTGVVVVICLLLAVLGLWIDHKISGNIFAYAAGTTVQTTGEGSLFYCHGEPVYLHIKHSAPMTALLRRYIEAECS